MKEADAAPIQLKGNTLAAEALWGLDRIARFAAVSGDVVKKWERLADSPVSKPGGRYFCLKSELLRWLRTKRAA